VRTMSPLQPPGLSTLLLGKGIVQNFMQPSPVAQHRVLFGRPNPGRMSNSHGIVEFGTIDFFGHPKIFSYEHSEWIHGNVSCTANKVSFG